MERDNHIFVSSFFTQKSGIHTFTEWFWSTEQRLRASNYATFITMHAGAAAALRHSHLPREWAVLPVRGERTSLKRRSVGTLSEVATGKTLLRTCRVRGEAWASQRPLERCLFYNIAIYISYLGFKT